MEPDPRREHTYATASHRSSSHLMRTSPPQQTNKRIVLLTTHVERQHISPTEQCSSSLQ